MVETEAVTSESAADASDLATHLPATVSGGSAAIAARLRQAILDGNYAYGERLPAERDLAEHFGASRSTVREALRRLEEAHLVTRRIGSGTFVSYRPSLGDGNIAELTSPIELIDVRLGVEPRIARLAAVHATARDLDRIGEALHRVEGSGEDREYFSRADEQFHLLLAECTHNPLMVWLYQQINDVRSHAQWNSMKDKILTGPRITAYNKEHRQLYEALRSRDVEAAERVITQHLEKARRHLLGVEL
ncbi:MAG: FadR/GntR family transcriptional regulator [Kiloniellales bacterium]